MEADIRLGAEYQAVEALYADFWAPGSLQPYAAEQLDIAGDDIWFIGNSIPATLDAGPRAAAYVVSGDGAPRLVHANARLLKVCAARRLLALVAARGEGDDLVEWHSLDGETPAVVWEAPGRVELLRWSPDGRRLCLLVAGRGADVSGREGGYALRGAPKGPDWLPEMTSPSAGDPWRALWLWDTPGEAPRRLTHAPFNSWEANWSGNTALAVVASTAHDEGSWFDASLIRLSLVDGLREERYQPTDQIACAVGSPDGRAIAWVEALCSDRGLVCGSLMLQIDANEPHILDTANTQVTEVAWRDPHRLIFTGLRGRETVVAEIDVETGDLTEHWSSSERTISGWQPTLVPAPGGGALTVVEGYNAPPLIAIVCAGKLHPRLALGPSQNPDVGSMSAVRWPGHDGLSIEGWLILPPEELRRPSTGWPLYVDIHGGPIFAHRCRWAPQLRSDPVLARQGWAVLLPNPRGSSGRGQAFARAVIGDMGGADMQDVLAGIDHLVADGTVDPSRVAAGGTSYGGFLASRLVTQTCRLAAAVPISPVTDWYHQHYASQAPWFDRAFLNASPSVAGGPYHERSPVFQAAGAATPTLILAGARDRNAPAAQSTEFYGALVEAGVPCALAIYPKGGHSLRSFPEYLDSAARLVAWVKFHSRSEKLDESLATGALGDRKF